MSTFIIGGIILVLFVLAARKLYKDKKEGKGCAGGCGGGCSSCPSAPKKKN